MAKSVYRMLLSFVCGAALAPSCAMAQNSAAPGAIPDEIQFRTASIMSEGTRMAAELFSLKSLEGKRLPTIFLPRLGWHRQGASSSGHRVRPGWLLRGEL